MEAVPVQSTPGPVAAGGLASSPAGIAVDGIVTSDAVVLDIETAGFSSRIVAGLIDLSIKAVLLWILAIAIGLAFLGDESGLRTAFAIASIIVIFGYPIGFETWLRGRTPGKAALGLRAVTTDGAPIRLREAALRAMGGLVDTFLPPGGITGALFVTLTPRHQRVGDLIAGTMVIRDPERHVASPALWFSPPPGMESYAETIDPTAITVEQYTVVRSFLTRGRTLNPRVRGPIGTDLATRLAVHLRHERPRWVNDDAFLVCAMARYQRRNGPGVASALRRPGQQPPPPSPGPPPGPTVPPGTSPPVPHPTTAGMPAAPDTAAGASWDPIPRPF